MRRATGRRLLSLVLALELLCTPLAMARAENPTRVREEIPLGEEVRPAQDDLPVSGDAVPELPAQSGGEGSRFSATLSAGEGDEDFQIDIDKLASNNDYFYDLGLSYGMAYDMANNLVEYYGGYLGPERGGEFISNSWGYSGGGSAARNRHVILGTDGYFYFCLPDMGRLPDKEMEGIYFYTPALTLAGTTFNSSGTASWAGNGSVLCTWSYDANTCVKLDLETVPEAYKAAVVAKLASANFVVPSGDYTLVRFYSKVENDQGEQVNLIDDKVALYGTPSSASAKPHWNIPLVVRWVDSSNSDMELFAMDVSSSTTGKSRTVDTLYTQPDFTGAVKADPDYSVTYAIQIPEDITNENWLGTPKTRSDTVFTPDPASGKEQHFYLQVGEEEDGVSLRFLTQEPYYKYHMVDNGGGPGPVVTVSGTFAATDRTVTLIQDPIPNSGWGDDSADPFFPQPLQNSPYGAIAPQNSASLPARGQWTVMDIPLQKVSEAANPNSDPFNVITVTVYSPSREETSVYVFHIKRLMTPKAALRYGNTPKGMILSDTGSIWSNDKVDWSPYITPPSTGEGTVADNKAAAITYFSTYHNLQSMPIWNGQSPSLSGRAIYQGDYNTLAWSNAGSYNPDLDETAIVVYQDMAFDDPGVSFVDSEGRTVRFGDGATDERYKESVTRTLKLRTLTSLSADSYGQTGTERWYTENGLSATQATQILSRFNATTGVGGTDSVNLRGLLVLPGIYTATYTFTDPNYDNPDHVHQWTSISNGQYRVCQDGTCGVTEIDRTVIVLPIPGDVDMDGAVTSADALALETKAGDWEGLNDPTYRLLRYRVYGMIRGSGNQNGATTAAKTIRGGFQPILGDTEATGYSDYMYLPLPYNGDDYHLRRAWDDLTPLDTAVGATLSLKFLGIEQGTWNLYGKDKYGEDVYYTSGITGPWSTATQNDNSGVSIVGGAPTSGQGDVFWMGVYVENPGALGGQNIQDLSLSLIYDSQYVRPATVCDYSTVQTAIDRGETALDLWQINTLLQYNLLTGAQGQTVFSGKTGSIYTYASSVKERAYTTHYSKAVGQLEESYLNADGLLDSRTNKLKEVVFSLQLVKGQSPAAMKQGYLLVLPFQLIKHPDARMEKGGEGDWAHLIELAGGMRDFSIVTTSGSAVGQAGTQGIFSLFDAQTIASTGSTYAFSAQNEIYGNSTTNIRAVMTYDDADSRIPVGEDHTEYIVLDDQVYDQQGSVSLGQSFLSTECEDDKLPPGMVWNPLSATISGIPTRVGTYQFTVDGHYYQITVKPRSIRYRVDPVSSYYGEGEFRGVSNSPERVAGPRDFTFTYNRADLSERDRRAGMALYGKSWMATATNAAGEEVPVWGTGEELKAIMEYNHNDGGGVVDYTAPLFKAMVDGVKTVTTTTGVGKYDVVPDNEPTSTNYELKYIYDTSITGQLTIEARPVWVSHMIATAQQLGLRIYNNQTGENLSVTIDEKKIKDMMEAEGETFQERIILTYKDQLTADKDGIYWLEDKPLTGKPRVEGDLFTLSAMGSYVRIKADNDLIAEQEKQGNQVAYYFDLTQDEEDRELRVTSIVDNLRAYSDAAENASNYRLMGASTDSGHLENEGTCQLSGTVIRLGVEKLRFTKYPGHLQHDLNDNPVLQGHYGDRVNHTALWVAVTLGAGDGGITVGEYEYNNTILKPMDIHYNWVSPEDKALGSQPEHQRDLVGTGWNPNADTAKGEKVDARPYNGTDPLTPDMDGWYLCAAVKMYESEPNDGKTKYIKVYSDYALSMAKMTITLTAQPTSRYYGEENGELSYTYDPSNLMADDSNALKAWVKDYYNDATAEPKLTGDELMAFLAHLEGAENVQAPNIAVAKTRAIPADKDGQLDQSQLVDKNTPVPPNNGYYYVILWGGGSGYYDFIFERPAIVDGMVSSSQTEKADDFSFQLMTMARRPIVIADIDSPTPNAGDETGKSGFATIYADTSNLYLQNQTAPQDRVHFTMPVQVDGKTYFYRYRGGGVQVSDPHTYENTQAVLTEDDVSVRYSVRFMCDAGHYYRNPLSSFDTNYYDVTALINAGGTLEKPVVIGDLVLEGEDAANYELVYNDARQAVDRTPDKVEGRTYEVPEGRGSTNSYLIYGTGTVMMRPVKGLVLRSAGQTNYTYGDLYAPYRNGSDGAPMTLVLEYETAVDEKHKEIDPANTDYEKNTHAETITFQVNYVQSADGSGNFVEVTTFSQRRLTIYYFHIDPSKLGDDQAVQAAMAEAVKNNQILDYTDSMIPDDHHGAYLFVVAEGDDPMQSNRSAQPLQVAGKSLTFTVQDAHRYYGERQHVNEMEKLPDNYDGSSSFDYLTNFSYTFPISQLVQRDQEALAAALSTPEKTVTVAELLARGDGTEADLKALAAYLDLHDPARTMGLVDPTYTPATVAVDAAVGSYEIGIETTNMRNYKVTGLPGTLHVYARPLVIDAVYSSRDVPVYTIYSKSRTMTFATQLDTAVRTDPATPRVGMIRSNINDGNDGLVLSQLCSDNRRRDLPLTGAALVGDDNLIFTVQVWFYDKPGSTWDLDDGQADLIRDQVRVSFQSLTTTDTSKNYTVSNAGSREVNGCYGVIKLRTIDEIFITRAPDLEHYTYGQSLDLSNLQVTIRYKASQGESFGESVAVNYLGPDNFREYGLYVNYWYPTDQHYQDKIPGGSKPGTTGGQDDTGQDMKDPTGATTTTKEEDEARKALPGIYRRADSGDHLTIAYTHDTQKWDTPEHWANSAASDPMERPFAANGKYLIISAFQEGDDQIPAIPKILGKEITTTGGQSFEGTPIAIRVAPLQLEYSLSAEDKTYDGTKEAAGTLTLENLFDQPSTKVRVEVEGEDERFIEITDYIRDVVYVPMGNTNYEDKGSDATVGYGDYLAKRQGSKVSFDTGDYQPSGEAPLRENGKLIWADGYTWGTGLTFTFANPNVHYLEAGETAPRGLGANMVDYWAADQSPEDVKDQWDHYRDVSAMPVEVTNMVLAGPDANNYTWATDGTLSHSTQVTIATRAREENDQAAAPYATIHKANRDTISDIIGTIAGAQLKLPYLQLDEHTNVVRLWYQQTLDDLGDQVDNNNAQGTVDPYRDDDLHFEYALYYEGEDGLMTQWAGPRGTKDYQDTTFFGGELVTPEVDEGYLPEYERMTQQGDAKDEPIHQGQLYRWAGVDTGVSEKGYREDGGIELDLDAYPGTADQAGAYYTWYYKLYKWGEEGESRAALPRNTVFYPLVRLSETHNYNPSGVLTGDEDVTAQRLDDVQKATAKLTGMAGEDGLRSEALAKSALLFADAQAMRAEALELSQRRVAEDAALAESNKFPEEGRELIGSASAVKTFLLRLDILSGGWERAKDGEYMVQTLEDVWFTDTTLYLESKLMDAVVFNSPTRYYNYFWDVDHSAQVRFGDKDMDVDFTNIMSVEIRRRLSDGTAVEEIHYYYPDASNHTDQIYVQTEPSGGAKVRTITIVPEVVYARLGDDPYQLSVVTTPERPSNRHYTWSTSDPSVVTVDATGLLTFRGVGTAIITVTTDNGRKGTAVVTVSAFLEVTQVPDTLFNFHYAGPWASLDRDYAFGPTIGMTRGELVMLLDIFLNPSAQWQATQELAYIDVTGREKYYEALKRLTGAGVVVGIPGGTFAGDQLATRAEFVTMLSRMLRLDIEDTRGMAHVFADAGEDSTWAYAYIDAMAKSGVIRGVGGGNFAPNRVITREETAAILARLLTTKLDLNRADLVRPSDMGPENWSYAAVLRAVNYVIYPE